MNHTFDFLTFLYDNDQSSTPNMSVHHLSFSYNEFWIDVFFDIEFEIDGFINEFNLDMIKAYQPFNITKITINIGSQTQNIFVLYAFLSSFLQQKDSILPYQIGGESLGYGCPETNSFILTIEQPSLQDYETITNFISHDVDNNAVKKPSFFNIYYDQYSFNNSLKLKSNPIKTLTAQTKARRIGYLSMILKMFQTTSYFPQNIYNKKVEQYAEKINNDLLTYTCNKGIIEITKTGNSAKPYVDLTTSLGLVFQENHAVRLAKQGKVYLVLQNQYSFSKENNFKLCEFEKIFFLSTFLKEDALYLWSLLEIIYIHKQTTIAQIKNHFQKYVLDQINIILQSPWINHKDKNHLFNRKKRIQEWKKPKTYLEHIIEPRVNWLLDLDLLDTELFKKNQISLSKAGSYLFYALALYEDLFFEKSAISDTIIDKDYFKLVNFVYSKEYSNFTSLDYEQIDYFINQSFILFKTMSPNRVTASQAILYCCYSMYFKEQKIIDYIDIINYLKSEKNTKYIFEWYQTENDGSIRKKKE